jgi:hypothetical protein
VGCRTRRLVTVQPLAGQQGVLANAPALLYDVSPNNPEQKLYCITAPRTPAERELYARQIESTDREIDALVYKLQRKAVPGAKERDTG